METYENEFEDVLEMARALLGGNEDASDLWEANDLCNRAIRLRAADPEAWILKCQILSALDDESLDGELAQLAYQGGTDAAARGPIELRKRLEEARQRGYAVDRDETAEGARCVAVPARIGGTLVGAIGLSGPSTRFGDARIVEMGARLMEVSARLAGVQR